MVKNTTGGKHKNQARKLSTNTNHSFVPTSNDPNECFALVTKMSGNGMCRVDLIHLGKIISDVCCHIRGKFKGRHKKHNIVSVNSRLLVGLREWSSIHLNCDLLFIYNELEYSHISDFNLLLPLSSSNELFDFNHNSNSTQHLHLPFVIDNEQHNHNHIDNDVDIDFELI